MQRFNCVYNRGFEVFRRSEFIEPIVFGTYTLLYNNKYNKYAENESVTSM